MAPILINAMVTVLTFSKIIMLPLCIILEMNIDLSLLVCVSTVVHLDKEQEPYIDVVVANLYPTAADFARRMTGPPTSTCAKSFL